MIKSWILASPASRGIGLSLTRQLLRTTSLPIIATTRSDPKGTKARILDGLSVDAQRLEVLELDVTVESTVSIAASHCRSRFSSTYLHLAFCIPGILYPEKTPTQISYAEALQTFRTNTLGPMLLMKHFSPFLPKKKDTLLSPSSTENGTLPPSAVFVIMSARVGSISDNSLGGWYSYRASKAGVNQIVKSLDIYLKNTAGEKAMSIGLHPGTVKTGLSKEFWASTKKEKLFEPDWVAERLLNVVKAIGTAGRGRCWDWQGEEVMP